MHRWCGVWGMGTLYSEEQKKEKLHFTRCTLPAPTHALPCCTGSTGSGLVPCRCLWRVDGQDASECASGPFEKWVGSSRGGITLRKRTNRGNPQPSHFDNQLMRPVLSVVQSHALSRSARLLGPPLVYVSCLPQFTRNGTSQVVIDIRSTTRTL